ncbi:MAG TPA: GWxTD domain-containing protein [Ignavibacteriaceae bacterium]|nr:GWxTD domain-containing protein [Ignavibacteriaceae bacterium]
MKKLTLVLLMIIPGSLILAQDKKIDFNIDYAQFSYDSDSNLVEFYYSFDTSSMLKIKEDSDTLVYIKGLLIINIEDTINHKELLNKQWEFKEPYSDDENSRSMVGALRFVIPDGVYKCTFTGSNFYDSTNTVVYTEIIEVNAFITDKVSISNLELAGKIVPGSQNKSSMFYKNTYEVVPSPNVVFGDNQPALFYYYEIYNLNQATLNVPLILNTQVFNTKGNLIYGKKKYITHNQDSRVEAGNINVNKFPVDSYTLVISVLDSIKNMGVSSSKKFYVYNEAVPNADTSYTSGDINSLRGQFYALSDEELDNLFEKSKYIAANSEINQYQSLNTTKAKRDFLDNFWKKRDSNPSTERNEYYESYFQRIDYANKNFSRIKTPGWKTDRGRIYIQYGVPTEIDRYPNAIDRKPYEVWVYSDIEGGVEFIFGDLTGLSNYQLLHSTKKGEINDPYWERRIRSL